MAHVSLKPGTIVLLSSRVTGGVSHKRADLPVDASLAPTEKAKVLRRETTTIISDPEERERATKLRSKLCGMIKKECISTQFGLLCPEANEEGLNKVIAEVNTLAREYNETSNVTKVYIYTLTGKIASNDEENARAISAEIQSLVARMDASIDRLDPEAIKKAASEAKRIASMLSPEASETVGLAVAAARKAARDITRLKGKGVVASVILKDIQRGAIEQARIAFLDLGDDVNAEGEMMPAVDVQRVAGLDLSDETPSEPPPAVAHDSGPELDLTGESAERVETAAAAAPAVLFE